MAMFFKVLLYCVSIISSLLLILVIMLQQTKSGGGLGAVSGGMTESMFGTSATSVLTKITTWLAVIFLASTLILGAVIGHGGKANKSVVETVKVNTTAPATTEAPKQAAPAVPETSKAPAAETPAK